MTHFRCVSTVPVVSNDHETVACLGRRWVCFLFVHRAERYRLCSLLVLVFGWTVVARRQWHNFHRRGKNNNEMLWCLIETLFLLQIWYEGQQKTKSCKFKLSHKVFGIKFRICPLNVFSPLCFVPCRIIPPEQNWKSWAHKDTFRETHYLMPFFLSPRCHIFRLYEFCVIAWNIPSAPPTLTHG